MPYRINAISEYDKNLWIANWDHGDYVHQNYEALSTEEREQYLRDVIGPLEAGVEFTDQQKAQIIPRAFITNLKTPDPSRPIADIIIMGGAGGPYFFSPRARAVFDRIAPGHVFYDFALIEVVDENNPKDQDRLARGTYHCLHVQTFIDCVDYDATTFRQGRGKEAGLSSGLGVATEDGDKLILKAKTVEGHQIWRGFDPDDPERSLVRWQHFISDQLKAALDEAGIVASWELEPCVLDTASVAAAE